MPTTKTCICCGYTSDNYHEFKRASLEAPSGLRLTDDDFICKSKWKCTDRTL